MGMGTAGPYIGTIFYPSVPTSGHVADFKKKKQKTAPTHPKKMHFGTKKAHINATYSQKVKENTYYFSHFTCSLLSLNTISSISFLLFPFFPFFLMMLQVLFHYSLNGQFQLKENSRIKYYILLN